MIKAGFRLYSFWSGFKHELFVLDLKSIQDFG